MNAQDAKQLADWGFNVIRLGVLWAGVEPVQGEYNYTYLSEIGTIIDTLAAENIYTIIDMHQDVLARNFCGNGIPGWAAELGSSEAKLPFPMPANMPLKKNIDGNPDLEACLSHDFIKYYFSGAVSKTFQALYENHFGLLDSFVDFWKLTISLFKDREYVLGYEIINEPWAGDIYSDPRRIFNAESSLLEPFYSVVHAAMRSVDDEKIVFYEPLTYDVWPVGFDENPVGGEEYAARSAMSYHIYCPLAGGNTTPLVLKLACQGVDWDFFHQRVQDIKRIGGGGMMTEWGSLSNSDLDLAELNHILRLADDYLVSHIYWQYKDYHDITSTGDAGISLYPNGVIQDDKVKVLARTYAEAVAGETLVMKYREDKNHFTLNYVPNALPGAGAAGEGGDDYDDDAAKTVVRVDRSHHYGGRWIDGIKVDVSWNGWGGDVTCSDDGRRVVLKHWGDGGGGDDDGNDKPEVNVHITPCRRFRDSKCTC
ncbi:hypothetical protein TrRE_jg4641 [Triparma retinervis]|uniref:Endoglycoceramidase n=1 Tax=Triparma retinervis TaxID=2557542 RepID=A0A9W6ZRN3_9STRA|nr:hypothetical protein TrRE_jg4641 [Triparma retinervis]